MARRVEEIGPIQLLEDAAHLLRRTSLDTLLCHWIGSVPLAMMLLFFWNRVTHPPVSDLACALQGLAAVVLLIWMNCWRSVFSGRLIRELTDVHGQTWNARRISTLIVGQAFLAGTKLLLLPLSLVAVFPLADTIAFFRNASVLAGRGDLDLLALIAKARLLAGRNRLQGWLLQGMLLLLSLIAAVNLAATFIILPQLVRMLTGYESSFTRSGESFFENRLFFLIVIAASWLLFDPFAQAVYCIRCFRGESVETGEDLRSGLRRLLSTIGKSGVAAAMALILLALTGLPVSSAAAVDTQQLERSVRKNMQSLEYNWRIPPPREAATNTSWIVRATDRAVAALRSAVRSFLKMVDRLLRWILGGAGLSPVPLGGQAPSTALHWSVWLLLSVATALAGWVAWRAFQLRSVKPKLVACPPPLAISLNDEDLTADRLSEEGWVDLAERCLAEGNLRLGLRAFYLANLAWLGRRRFLTIEPGRSNHEFEIELQRKARQSPQARDLFTANIRDFERAWYGMHDVFEEDTREFRRRVQEMKTHLGEEAA